MKTNEQIELANNAIKDLKDYIELARVEKKLTNNERANLIADIVADTVQRLRLSIDEL